MLIGGILTILIAPFPSQNWRWFVAGMLSVFVPMGFLVVHLLGQKKRRGRAKPHGIIIF